MLMAFYHNTVKLCFCTQATHATYFPAICIFTLLIFTGVIPGIFHLHVVDDEAVILRKWKGQNIENEIPKKVGE